MNAPTSAVVVAPLLSVWECSGCGRQALAMPHAGGVWVEHEVTRALVLEPIAPGGWRLTRPCARCGGIVSLLYANAALTRTGKLLIFRDRGYAGR